MKAVRVANPITNIGRAPVSSNFGNGDLIAVAVTAAARHAVAMPPEAVATTAGIRPSEFTAAIAKKPATNQGNLGTRPAPVHPEEQRQPALGRGPATRRG